MPERTPVTLQVIFFLLLLITTLSAISVTLWQYPLFPFNKSSLDWSNAWLDATIVDYYGACLCFSGVVIASEQTWLKGILWTAGFCLAGSPVCCLWVVLRLWRGGGTLRLERNEHSEIGERRNIL